MDSNLSPRQERILRYIPHFIKEMGYPPTLREIGQHVGLRSSSSVAYQLRQLEARGLIKRSSDKNRAIRMVRKPVTLTPEEQQALTAAAIADELIVTVEKILNDRLAG